MGDFDTLYIHHITRDGRPLAGCCKPTFKFRCATIFWEVYTFNIYRHLTEEIKIVGNNCCGSILSLV